MQDCGFSRSVLVPLEGRESVGGGRNATLSHLFEVRSAYQRVFPARRTQTRLSLCRTEETRGEERGETKRGGGMRKGEKRQRETTKGEEGKKRRDDQG